ncbi:MAG TPA: hypothetical protein VGE07_18075 [Herpetosiphonaceae bacterium]
MIVFWSLLALLLLPMVVSREYEPIKVCKPSVQTTRVHVGWPWRVVSSYSVPCGKVAVSRTWYWGSLAWHTGSALIIASLAGGLLAEARRARPRKVMTGFVILLSLAGLTLFLGGIGEMIGCRDKEGTCGMWFLMISLPGAALAAIGLIVAVIGGASLARPVRLLGYATVPLGVLCFIGLVIRVMVP